MTIIIISIIYYISTLFFSDTPDDQSRMENGRYPSQYDPEA